MILVAKYVRLWYIILCNNIVCPVFIFISYLVLFLIIQHSDSTDGRRSSSVLEELPRSSSVISKPYSPVAADIVARRLEAMRRYFKTCLKLANIASHLNTTPRQYTIPPSEYKILQPSKFLLNNLFPPN